MKKRQKEHCETKGIAAMCSAFNSLVGLAAFRGPILVPLNPIFREAYGYLYDGFSQVAKNRFWCWFDAIEQHLAEQSSLVLSKNVSKPVLEISAHVRRKLNGTVSNMLSRITGRTIADEAREPTLDVVMRARDRRWNWFAHNLRL